MNETQIAKIKQFLGDKEMQLTIKNLLRDKFLEKRNTDVNFLAAQALAVQLLGDSWIDMERYKQSEAIKPVTRQPGL